MSMINIGDRVKFVSDTGVGIVRSIKSGVAQVEVDGFEIPALVSDIVLAPIEDDAIARQKIGPSTPKTRDSAPRSKGNNFGKLSIDDDFEDEPIDVFALKRQFAATQKALVSDQAVAVEPVKIPQYQLTDYVVKLFFVPTSVDRSPQECDLDLYLVNDSTYELSYAIGRMERAGYVTTLANGKIEEDTKLKITRFKRHELNNVINLHVAVMPFKSENYVAQQVVVTNIEMHPLKFVRENNYTENDYFDERAFCFTLADNTQK